MLVSCAKTARTTCGSSWIAARADSAMSADPVELRVLLT